MFRPDITVMVDWALKINNLSFVYSIDAYYLSLVQRYEHALASRCALKVFFLLLLLLLLIIIIIKFVANGVTVVAQWTDPLSRRACALGSAPFPGKLHSKWLVGVR